MRESTHGEGPSIAHSMFVIDNPGKFADFYDMEERLGEGSYARVCFCRNRYTGEPRAVKICSITRPAMLQMFYKELKYIKMLDHPNIVRLYEHFEDSRYLYMILELCSGGELFDRLLDVGSFSESQAAILMHHIILAVRHMHARNVCHRDLKIENWLLCTKEPVENNRVKVCDFNLSTVMQAGEEMTTKCGIPYFVSPQILAGKYDKGCDLWACGVLMYTLLCGYPPFYGASDAEILSRVKTGVYTYDSQDFSAVSEDAKDMINGLLKYDPAERLTARQALSHNWFRLKLTEKILPMKLKQLDNIRAYGKMGILKKACLLAVANGIDEEFKTPIIETFMWLDNSGEGSICVQELKTGLELAGFSGEGESLDLAEEIMSSVDVDGMSGLNYSEFVAACLDYRVYTREEVLWGTFRIFDRKGFGRIGPADLRDVWGSQASKEWCTEALQQVTGQESAFLDYDGFCAMMKGKTKPRLLKGNTKDVIKKPKRARGNRNSAKAAARLHDSEDQRRGEEESVGILDEAAAGAGDLEDQREAEEEAARPSQIAAKLHDLEDQRQATEKQTGTLKVAKAAGELSGRAAPKWPAASPDTE